MLLWLLALAGLLLYAAFTAHLCLLALNDPYQLDYGEGLVLHQVRLLAQGQSIYKGIDSYPYIFSNYPPLFQALLSPLESVLGPSFLPGRVLAVLASIGLGLILFRLVLRSGGSVLPAAIAGLLFVGSPYIYHWAALFRIDLPALFLSVLGMLVLWSATTGAVTGTSRSTPGRRSVYIAGLLFALSLYTKQSYIAAPAAALIYLALHNRRAAAHLVLALAVFGLIPFIAIEIATGGAFSFGLFTANVNPLSLSLLASQTRDFIITFAAIIVLAIIGAATVTWRHGAGETRRSAATSSSHLRFSLLDWYLVAAVATILLAGKVGAWENYFFEALFMLCVYAGLGIDWLSKGSRVRVQLALPVCLIVQLALMWHDPSIGVRVVREDGEANRALAPLIARQDGMILSEDLGLLLVNGKDVPYFSFQYAQLARVGRWDQHWEIDNLRAGRFALVILEKGTREDPDKYQRFTREVLSAVDAAYGLVTEVGKYRVYAPMPLLRQMDATFGDQIALLGYRLDALLTQTSDIAIPSPAPSLPVLTPYPPKLRLTLLWQARAKTAIGYKVFVHLEDAGGVRRAQSDAVPFFGLYPTQRWAEGEMVRDYLDLELPPGLPSGRYILRVGLYDPATSKRLAQPDGSTSLLLASLPFGPAARPTLPPNPRLISFANGISLTGYDLSTTRLAAGSPLTVVLFWRTDTYIDRDLTVFVHLVGLDGKPLAQADGPPQLGAYPTSSWNPGQDVADVHSLSIPRDLPSGTYRLLVGLYDQPAATRILLASGEDNVLLSDIQVTP